MDCSLFLLTCDKYAFVAEQNLICLEKYWQFCPFQIYVGLESGCITNDTFSPIVLKSASNLWSERVIEQLKQISSKYVFVILDDFFLESEVNEEIINEAIRVMENDSSIANISFMNYIGRKKDYFNNPYFVVREKNRPSLLNWQVGLWDREKLILMLSPNESPWESELYGSLRARYLFDYKFLCLKDDVLKPFEYGEGWLIVRGKWNEFEINRLEKKCDIHINVGNFKCEKITKIETPILKRIENRIKINRYEKKLRRKIK